MVVEGPAGTALVSPLLASIVGGIDETDGLLRSAEGGGGGCGVPTGGPGEGPRILPFPLWPLPWPEVAADTLPRADCCAFSS